MNVDNNIPKDWVETTLGDVANVTTGFPFKSKEYSSSGKLRVVRGENVSLKRLRWDNEKFWNSSIKNLEQYFLEENDIVIGMDGSRIGKNKSSIPLKELPLILAQRVARVKSKDGIAQGYLKYSILNNKFELYINKVQTGTSIPHISLGLIKDFSIVIPTNIEEQKAIAKILTAFDDKIENLQAQNKTLETTAQTIFKERFGKYQIGDDLPEGWRVGKLGEIANLKSGYAFKSKDFVETSKFKALKIKDLKGNGVVSTSDVSSLDEECTKIERVQFFKLVQGDIVLAMSGNTTGKIGVIPPHKIELFLNQRVGKFFLKDEIFKSYLYNFLMSANYEDKILSMGYGSAQPNISPSQIENIDIIFPKDDILQEYKDLSNPIFDKVLMNNEQIQTLKKTRDTLLPKLMNGSLRVNDFKE